MTRAVGTAFAGASVYEVDVDQVTYRDVLERAVEDIALIDDILTGANSPPITHDHSGPGTGSLLGVPIAQQLMPIDDDHQALLDSSSAGDGDIFIFALPVFVPGGETTVTVDFTCDRLGSAANDVVCQMRNSSWAVIAEQVEIITPNDAQKERHVVTIDGLTGGTLYYLTVKTRMSSFIVNTGPIKGLRIFQERKAAASGPVMGLPTDSNDGSIYTVPTTTPGSVVKDVAQIDDAVVADGLAYSAFLLTHVNQAQNAITEHLTASPAGTNEALTLTTSGSTNPTQTAFHDHSTSGYSTEPEIDFPVACEAYGYCEDDGSAKTSSSGQWVAPGLLTAGSAKLLSKIEAYLPDFPAGAGSKLTATMLAVSPDTTWGAGTTANFEATTEDSSGGATGSGSAALTQIGSTKFAIATIAGLDFNPDAANLLGVLVNASALSVSDGTSLRVLGVCWYFEA